MDPIAHQGRNVGQTRPEEAAVKKLCLLGLVLSAFACGAKSDKAMQTEKPVMTDKSLFERLGGLDAIKAVVDDFVANVAADPVINARFASTDIPSFKQKLVDQICEVSGGPCKYTGKDMPTAHAGMNITDAEFGALVSDLQKTLDKLKVPAREQGELLGALGAMKPDIVGK
jgi:hemoglobin